MHFLYYCCVAKSSSKKGHALLKLKQLCSPFFLSNQRVIHLDKLLTIACWRTIFSTFQKNYYILIWTKELLMPWKNFPPIQHWESWPPSWSPIWNTCPTSQLTYAAWWKLTDWSIAMEAELEIPDRDPIRPCPMVLPIVPPAPMAATHPERLMVVWWPRDQTKTKSKRSSTGLVTNWMSQQDRENMAGRPQIGKEMSLYLAVK